MKITKEEAITLHLALSVYIQHTRKHITPEYLPHTALREAEELRKRCEKEHNIF